MYLSLNLNFSYSRILKSTENYDNDVMTEKGSYYPNGILKERSSYKDGKEHGKCESYYENGTIKEVKVYEDGDLHGTWVTHDIKELL
jgi:antitoxin component YwqK of YwqJK toxin-antitoxin module